MSPVVTTGVVSTIVARAGGNCIWGFATLRQFVSYGLIASSRTTHPLSGLLTTRKWWRIEHVTYRLFGNHPRKPRGCPGLQ